MRTFQAQCRWGAEILSEHRPLPHMIRVACKFNTQRNRRATGNRIPTALESCPHRFGKRRSPEFKVARHEPKVVIILHKVVIVLHSAVGHSELHHGLELLGDDRLSGIDANARASSLAVQRLWRRAAGVIGPAAGTEGMHRFPNKCTL